MNSAMSAIAINRSTASRASGILKMAGSRAGEFPASNTMRSSLIGVQVTIPQVSDRSTLDLLNAESEAANLHLSWLESRMPC
jgi:hypothetical protein